MTSAIRIDHFNKRILISKSFQKAAMNPTSNEYADLAEVMSKHSDYKIARRAIKKNPQKETYAGLTYDFMKDYIIRQSYYDESTRLSEFEEMLLVSKCHNKAQRYPTIKKWFLEKYPEVEMYRRGVL